MGKITNALKHGTAPVLVAHLTPMQQRFVAELVSGGKNPTEAARLAGFANPKSSGYAMTRLPHVVAAIRQERVKVFDGDLANVAADTLRQVMTDPEAPAAARVSAARTVLEVTRELGRRQDDGGNDKQLHEMTPDELASLISKWEGERHKVAKDITDQVEIIEKVD